MWPQNKIENIIVSSIMDVFLDLDYPIHKDQFLTTASSVLTHVPILMVFLYFVGKIM